MFTTERLLIEPLRQEDADGWFAALSDPRVSAYFDDPEVTTIEALRERVEHLLAGPPQSRPDEYWLNWMVRLAGPDGQAGAIIGRLEATIYDAGRWGEVAYLFDPRVWGRGYAVEAGRWMVAHLDTLGVDTLWACITPANQASIRLVERLGFASTDELPAEGLGSYDPGDALFVRGLS